MSTTSIYRLGREPEEIGEARNAWRGAMYVWNDIAQRYFGLPNFPMGRDEIASKIWNAHRHHDLPEHEAIVLMSTMDHATVRGRDASIVAEAFERYGREHPNSSLREQAEILRSAELQPNDYLAWQQTSVAEFWGCQWDGEKDEPDWYDPATGDKHFDVVEAARGSQSSR
jgi:hypothetical protein